MKCYVYSLRNIINDKIYIGKSKNPTKRFAWHKSIARFNNYSNHSLIHRAINKHGAENFKFEIISEFEDELQASNGEKFWIVYFKSNVHRYGDDFGYNLTDGGDGISGLKHSQESKDKVSRANKNKIVSSETKIRMSDSHKGKPSAMLGKHHSTKTKQKISIHNIGDKNYFYGKSFIGVNHPTAKLTDEKVIEILVLLKEEKLTQKQISIIYGVTVPTINKINLGKTWRHIKRDV